MKIFMILNGYCHWDATAQVATLDEAHQRFAPDMEFVEAPEWVFEGWGYSPDAEGDSRFIKPIPPEGWVYDDATGTMYPAEDAPGGGSGGDVWDELAAAYAEGVNLA